MFGLASGAHRFFLLFVFVFAVSYASWPPFLVSAQGSGLSISPSIMEETVEPGLVYQFSLSVRNLNSQDQNFFVFTRNISGVQDGGTPVFASSNDEFTGFELADWVTLPFDQVFIPGGEAVNIDYTISVPDNASPGSHFGGVFISAEPPEIRESGAAVGYQVANIMSLRVAGDVVEQASIRQFSTNKFLYGAKNVLFNVKIENAGNTLIKPVGPLEIYNMLGQQVDSIVFNESAAGVFPYTTREFSDIVWEGGSIGFGRYEAVLSPVYGEPGARKTVSTSVTFWVLPMSIIGPALIALTVVFVVIFISVRIYVRRSLEQINYGRRMVRRRKKSGSSTILLLAIIFLTVSALFMLVLLALFA